MRATHSESGAQEGLPPREVLDGGRGNGQLARKLGAPDSRVLGRVVGRRAGRRARTDAANHSSGTAAPAPGHQLIEDEVGRQ